MKVLPPLSNAFISKMIRAGQTIVSPRLNTPRRLASPRRIATAHTTTSTTSEFGTEMLKNAGNKSPRAKSPKKSPRLRSFTCCTATQPLISAYGELSSAVREFLLFNSSNSIIGEFPEKFSQMTPVFESYCTQTAGHLSMMKTTTVPPTLMASTVDTIRKTLADVYESYEKIATCGLTAHAQAVESNFAALNSIFTRIKRVSQKDHFFDDSALAGLPSLKKMAAGMKIKGIEILNNNEGAEEAKKYANEIRMFSRRVNTYIDKSLPVTIFPSKEKIRLRSEATTCIGAVAEIVESSQQLPEQVKLIGELMKEFAQLLEETNAKIGLPNVK